MFRLDSADTRPTLHRPGLDGLHLVHYDEERLLHPHLVVHRQRGYLHRIGEP